MRFFSKIVFICNICFALAAVLRIMEQRRELQGNHDAIIPLPPLQGILVTLGFGVAVVINFIFVVCVLIFLLLKKQHHIARWLVWINLLFLLFQFFYFKLY